MVAVKAAVLAAISLVSVPEIKVQIAVAECGDVNAYYAPDADTIVLCIENLTLPAGVQRFLLAHELGHATIDQLNLPIPGSEEAAADEFAAIALAQSGHADDLEATAKWFDSLAELDPDENVHDDHQSHAKRAATIRCLGWGAKAIPFAKMCTAKYNKISNNWQRLITAYSGGKNQ